MPFMKHFPEGMTKKLPQGLFVQVILDRLLTAGAGIKMLLLSHVKVAPLLTKLQLHGKDFFFYFLV